MKSSSIRVIARNVLIGSLIASGLLGIFSLLFGEFGQLEQKILLTSVTVSAGSILGMAGGAVLDRSPSSTVARVTVFAAILSVLLILVLIWFEISEDVYAKLTVSVTIVSIALSHICLVSLARLSTRFQLIQSTTYMFAAVVAASLIVLVLEDGIDSETYWKWVGVNSIILSVLTVLTPILHFMSRGEIQAEPKPVPPKVNLANVMDEIETFWSPREVAAVSGHAIRAAKVKGAFEFHRHDREDEFFLVLKGALDLHFRDNIVSLHEGEGLLVPAGVEHKPVAEEEAQVLLFEPISTLRRGNLEVD